MIGHLQRTVVPATLMLLSAGALAEGVQFFEGAWEEALAKAAKEDKHVFVQSTAVWCGPCKLLEREVLTLDEVGDFFNQHFVYVLWDYDDEGEELSALRDRYDFGKDADGLPGYLVLDGNGNETHRSGSYMEPPIFLQMAKTALGEEESVVVSLERFMAGERDIDFLDRFIDKFPLLFLEGHLPNEEQDRYVPILAQAANGYIGQLTGEERFTKKVLDRMSMLLFLEQSGQGPFTAVDVFLDHFERYQAIYAMSPSRPFKDQYETMTPIYADILERRTESVPPKQE